MNSRQPISAAARASVGRARVLAAGGKVLLTAAGGAGSAGDRFRVLDDRGEWWDEGEATAATAAGENENVAAGGDGDEDLLLLG